VQCCLSLHADIDFGAFRLVARESTPSVLAESRERPLWQLVVVLLASIALIVAFVITLAFVVARLVTGAAY